MPTQADTKRYASTRGLRSIAYLIISDISMTNASAIHLSSILSIHRPPEQLLGYLPGGKALILPDMASHCKGIIWLPNKDLSPLGHRLLDMAEMFRDIVSDVDSDEEFVEEYNTPSKITGYYESFVTDSPSHDDDIKRQRQRRKKMDIEYSRLAKRVRIEVLQAEGVHSADIWSVTLKMMVVCRALLLDDKDRHTNSVEKAQPERLSGCSEAESVLETREQAPSVTAADIVRGHYHAHDDFAVEFPALPTVKTATFETPTKPKNGRLSTPPSQNQVAHAETSHACTSPGAPSAGKQAWRFGLPVEIWRRIIADAVSAEAILDREQQFQVMRYASDWNALAYELTITGAAEHQQIWKFLDTVNCFTYNPLS